MPAPSNPARAHRFIPRGLAGYSSQDLRVSDAERTEVTDRLAEHYADGRLDQAEFNERAEQAMRAKTRSDLSGLLLDLPATSADAAAAAEDLGRRRPRRGGHRGGHRGVLAVALVLVIVAVAGRPMAWVYQPWAGMGFLGGWVWFGLLAAVIVYASRRFHHPSE
jgi:hypothetical protein